MYHCDILSVQREHTAYTPGWVDIAEWTHASVHARPLLQDVYSVFLHLVRLPHMTPLPRVVKHTAQCLRQSRGDALVSFTH